MLAMCWKCASKIEEPDITGFSYKLVGCKECDKVVDYTTAQKYCPIIDRDEPVEE